MRVSVRSAKYTTYSLVDKTDADQEYVAYEWIEFQDTTQVKTFTTKNSTSFYELIYLGDA